MADIEMFYTITTIIFLMLTIITIIFSLLTILIVTIHWNTQYRSIKNLVICNSCVTLLYYSFATIIEILFISKNTLNEKNITIFCKIRAAIHLSASISAALSYLVQAVSRYFITILYKYRIFLTFRINWILISLNWIISFILSLLMFISPVAFQYESESRMCFLTIKNFQTSFPIVMIVFCIPLNIIIFLYISILRHSTSQNLIHFNTLFILRMKRNIKVFQNILISIIAFAIGGTPYFISIIIHQIVGIPWQLYTLSVLFISISAAFNSLTIFFLNKHIRTYFYKKIQWYKKENINQIIPLSILNKSFINEI